MSSIGLKVKWNFISKQEKKKVLWFFTRYPVFCVGDVTECSFFSKQLYIVHFIKCSSQPQPWNHLKSWPITHSDYTLTAHHGHESIWSSSSFLAFTDLCSARSVSLETTISNSFFLNPVCSCSMFYSSMCFSLSTGQFLWVNSSAFSGPWVLSPWLRGGQGPCSLDMAVFLHPKQTGQYTIWLIERDKPQLALFSTDTLPRITG